MKKTHLYWEYVRCAGIQLCLIIFVVLFVIPLEFSVGESNDTTQIKDVGVGGLCFVNQYPVNTDEHIRITIPVFVPKFVLNGIVRWCKQVDTQFLVGVAFQEESMVFEVKLLEQICHIESYRKHVKAERGLELTSEEAAKEWIGQYAEGFPTISN